MRPLLRQLDNRLSQHRHKARLCSMLISSTAESTSWEDWTGKRGSSARKARFPRQTRGVRALGKMADAPTTTITRMTPEARPIKVSKMSILTQLVHQFNAAKNLLGSIYCVKPRQMALYWLFFNMLETFECRRRTRTKSTSAAFSSLDGTELMR